MTKTEGKYHDINWRIHDIAAIEYGHYLMECFIKYANEGLIGELYIFKSIETNLTDDFVVLPEEMEERYFERLLDDLKQGDIYSTLHNNQLVHKSFRTKLIRYLQHNEKDLKKVFNQMDKDGIKLLTWESHYFMGYAFDDDHERVNVTFPLIEAAIEGYADIVEFLIKMNCDVNKKDSFHRTALYKACEGGYQDAVDILLNHNADASLCHEDGSSPLHMACKAGNTNIVKLILEKHDNVNRVSHFSDTPLKLACKGGYIDIVKILLGKKAQVFGIRGSKSPLFLACDIGNEAIVKMLLATHTDPLYLDGIEYYWDGHAYERACSPLDVVCQKNHINIIQLLFQKYKFSSYFKWSALYTASYNGSIDIVKLLMETTDFILFEKLDFSLDKAMFYACEGGNLEVVQYFLKQGFNIFKCNDAGQSLLHATCEFSNENEGSTSVLNLLITKQLPISKPDKKGLAPLHLACKYSLHSICKILISHNANINMQDNENMSPLHYACEANNFDIVGILLRNKANIQLTDNAGRTPLHVICERCKSLWSLRPSEYPDIHLSRSNTKSKSIVKSLIDFDAEVNARDKFGESPLHKTCKYEDYELVKMLLSLKLSDINLQNIWGQTPLHLACDYGYENIVQLLLAEKLSVLKKDDQGKSPLDVSSEILKRIKDNLAYYIWLDNCDHCDALHDESLESSSFNTYSNIVNLLTEDNADISKS